MPLKPAFVSLPPFVNLLAATALISPALLSPAAAQTSPRIFYVDFDKGSDSADGRSPATAWKRGPWDPEATGANRRLALLPGDTIRFKGGVRYRGQLPVRATGTPDQPVVFDGSSWGPTRAILDGSQELGGVRRCQSAAECFDNPNWKLLWRATVPATASWTDWLFVNDQPLLPAQYPSLPDADYDNIDRYIAIPKAALARLQAGSIAAPLPPELQQGSPVLALWAQPNVIAYTSDVRVGTGGLEFAGARWINGSLNPYTDRDNRFSIVNAPAQVNRPGLFAMSPKDGLVIFWPPAVNALTYKVSIGTGRYGFNLNGGDHVTIRGFSFANFSAKPGNASSGIGILVNSSVDGATIADNAFRGFANIANGGIGAIRLVGATNTRITGNLLTALPGTSGITIDNSKGPVLVQCNRLSNLGRTGIRFINVKDGTIRANHLTGINGIHGNAITAYNDIRGGLIADNIVTDSVRPLTVKGGGSTTYFDSGTRGMRVQNNIFISNSADSGAVISWGTTPNMVMTGNFLSAPRFALKLAGSETGFEASGNLLVGSVALPKGSSLFDAAANTVHGPEGNGALLTAERAQRQLPASLCG